MPAATPGRPCTNNTCHDAGTSRSQEARTPFARTACLSQLRIATNKRPPLSSNRRSSFIAAQTAQYAVTVLCQTLDVSRSGFYAWQQRPVTSDPLTPQVITTFWRHARRYGSRRLTAELQAAEVAIGRRRVRRIMRAEQLHAIQPKSFVPRTTNSRHGGRMSPNLLADYTARAPA